MVGQMKCRRTSRCRTLMLEVLAMNLLLRHQKEMAHFQTGSELQLELLHQMKQCFALLIRKGLELVPTGHFQTAML